MRNESTARGSGASWWMVTMCTVLVACSFVLVSQSALRAKATEEKLEASDEFYQMAPVLCEVYTQIREKYVEQVKSRDLIEGAIQGMFTKLDPHSQWMPAQDYQ
ncbi:hypothetical protein FJY63_14345, partial [Candidatus Sumerlaeota bacterium]|nr:hypothetical protein [Candidatus Sumerlaeota bacterium]